MKFHHVGIPTTEKKGEEIYLEDAKLYVTEIDDSPHKIEWLRFEDGSPMPKELQTIAHIAYEVDNLNVALEGQEILIEPFTPMEGVTVAFVLENGAPIEYMEVSK